LPDPGFALLGFALIFLLLSGVFWPRWGLYHRLMRVHRLTDRVQIEDGLKHIQDCETRGVTCTLESLAGALETGRSEAFRVLARLQSSGFARPTERGGYLLTEAGRSYALRILRTHRLVERYLADRTGVSPREWHLEAERQEHLLTSAQTERLARQMGHPLYDPHGDPIPTAQGRMPEAHGGPLSGVLPNVSVAVIHLEDEPPEVYERLLGAGFALGDVLRVIAVEPNRIRFIKDGIESSLAKPLAANVTVETIAEPGALDPSVATLDRIGIGELATVVSLAAACRGQQRRRLLDLGVVPGTVIRAAMRSAAGDPIAYEIRGALIGLRREQAAWVRVRRGGEAEAAA
jgi:DtxR family Mn-dependent transcriptional regulator